MNVVEVRPTPDNLKELGKCATSLWQPGVIRCQVASVQVFNAARPARERTEIGASTQVESGVYFCLSTKRWRKQERVSGGGILSRRAERVTPVAVCLRIDNVAS